LFPNVLPTYYSLTPFFQNAQSILCDTSVTLQAITGINPGGSGFISGYIGNGAGKNSEIGEPLSNLDLLLVKLNGTPIMHTKTDNNGYFEFENLNCQAYYIWVDDATTKNNLFEGVLLSDNNCNQANLKFVLKDNVLKLDKETAIKEINKNILFNISPNPTNGNFEIRVLNSKNVTLEVKSLLGETIYKQKLEKEVTIVKSENWAKGMYYAILTNDKKEIVGINRIIKN